MKLATLAAVLALGAPAILAHAQEAPMPSSFSSTSQLRAASVQHWGVIAGDIADQLATKLPAGASVHVKEKADATAFESGLAELLKTSLHGHGFKVSTGPREGAHEVDVSTMAVTHWAHADTLFAGTSTLLSAGLLVLRDIVLGDWKAGVLASGLMSDVSRQVVKPSPGARSELAVTTSVVSNGVYVVRKTDVYYTAAADAGLYGGAKPLRVQGGP